jgi:hypothetical protein
MLIGLFKSNQKAVNVITILLVMLLWVPAFFSIEVGLQVISTGLRWVDLLLMICLLICQAIYLNFVVSEYKLVKDNSHLTSLAYVILNSCFLCLFELNAVVLSNTFVLVALHQLFRLYGTKNNFTISYAIGILIGIAGLIYSPMFIYFILLWAFLIYTITPSWRDFIVSLLGFLTPLAYYLVYKFVFDELAMFNLMDYLSQTFIVSLDSLSIYNQLFLLGLFFIVVFAILNLFVTISRSGVKVSKFLVMVFLMLFLGVGSLFLNQNDFIATFLVLTVPLAIIIANFFQNMQKVWLSEILFLYLMVTILLGYFL